MKTLALALVMAMAVSAQSPVVRLPKDGLGKLCISCPLPAYPEGVRAMKDAVVLMVTVGTTGKVEDVKFMSGNEAYRKAAVDAAWRWTFKPHVKDGKVVRAASTVKVPFVPPGPIGKPVPEKSPAGSMKPRGR
jgi:TonB family protein